MAYKTQKYHKKTLQKGDVTAMLTCNSHSSVLYQDAGSTSKLIHILPATDRCASHPQHKETGMGYEAKISQTSSDDSQTICVLYEETGS